MRMIALVGKPAVGKTTLANQLATILGHDLLSIDTERAQGGDWHTLITKVNLANKPTIVESVAMPAAYRQALTAHAATVILITCDETTRLQRLQDRGDPPTPARDYPNRCATLHLDTTQPVDAQAIADQLGGRSNH